MNITKKNTSEEKLLLKNLTELEIGKISISLNNWKDYLNKKDDILRYFKILK